MTIIDKRFKADEMNILQQLVGMKIISFKHDEFHFINSSSQVVGIETACGMVYLYSLTEPLDYYGSIEDVAIWQITHEQYKFVGKKKFISSPINEKIKEICIVQENQRLFENNEQIYDVWVTRGIIFDFGDYQYSLEKPIWFSEDIYIRKGYDLINKFSSVNNFINDDWTDGCTAECSREIIHIG